MKNNIFVKKIKLFKNKISCHENWKKKKEDMQTVDFFNKEDAYRKSNKPLTVHDVNVVFKQKEDRIERISFYDNVNSALHAIFYNEKYNSLLKKEKFEFIESKIEFYSKNLTEDSFKSSICVFSQELSKCLQKVVETNREENPEKQLIHSIILNSLKDIDINQFFIDMNQQLKFQNYQEMEESFLRFYLDKIKNHLNTIETTNLDDSSSSSHESFEKYKNVLTCYWKEELLPKATRTKLQKFKDSLVKGEYNLSPEQLYFFYNACINEYNLLIIDITTKQLLNSIKLKNDTIDTSKKCLVLLYFPHENAYERVFFDSYTSNNGTFENETEFILKKKSKKNKNLYRYFVFEYDHFFIKYLLQ